MAKKAALPKRAQQALDLVYQKGAVTANDLMDHLPDLPSYSAARSVLRNLEKKGHIFHERRGMHYVFLPTTSPEKAKAKALDHIVETFFQGSRVSAMKSLLGDGEPTLNAAEIEELEILLAQARRDGE